MNSWTGSGGYLDEKNHRVVLRGISSLNNGELAYFVKSEKLYFDITHFSYGTPQMQDYHKCVFHVLKKSPEMNLQEHELSDISEK